MIPMAKTPLVESRALPVRKVLLVEDEAIVRKSLTRQLKHLGLEVVSVGSAAEALAAIAAELPEVVLSDLSMPGMDGVALARKLREQHPSLPIVIMSGNVPEELQPQLVELNLARLDKPFGEAELRNTLEHLVG
jgi:two-component system, cell cycle sensor histidine kinase and response regulator CckA